MAPWSRARARFATACRWLPRPRAAGDAVGNTLAEAAVMTLVVGLGALPPGGLLRRSKEACGVRCAFP
eukprot:9796901-Lingulodinium_polyedra.AAC.1